LFFLTQILKLRLVLNVKTYMYRKLAIFLLFYVSCAVFSSAFASSELVLSKNHLFSYAEDASEDGNCIDSLLKNLLPEFDSNDRPVVSEILKNNSGLSLYGLFYSGQQLLQSDRIVHSHLFLLFHSFLFYDIL